MNSKIIKKFTVTLLLDYNNNMKCYFKLYNE